MNEEKSILEISLEIRKEFGENIPHNIQAKIVEVEKVVKILTTCDKENLIEYLLDQQEDIRTFAEKRLKTIEGESNVNFKS